MQTTNRVKNPRKQRKRLFNAPAHIRHKCMAAPLSKELAAQKGVKTLPVRKGDTVHIQRGEHKGFEGKISRVDLKHFRIYMEGLTREKTDGTNIFLAIHPSKVMIRNLNLDDKWRKNIISRKEAPKTKKEERVKATPPAKKPAAVPEVKPAKVEEVKEEKPAVVAPVVEKAVPKVAKEEKPAAVEKAPEKAPAAKKAPAKKPAAKKPAAKAAPEKKAEAKIEETAPAKKEAKPKAAKAAKKAPAAKKPAKEAAPKTRAKPKASKKVEGGQ